MNIEFMKMAIAEAEKTEKKDEVPIGAVIVKDGVVVAKGRNMVEEKNDATFHAEIVAIKSASKKLKSWRLDDCDIYVTLEPCAMCAGAIVNSRIKNVYFGAYEKKSGAVVSKMDVLKNSGLNHRCDFIGGIMEKECKNLLKSYFKLKRKQKKLD